MIDLHMHTTCSDGQFSPEETMRMAITGTFMCSFRAANA